MHATAISGPLRRNRTHLAASAALTLALLAGAAQAAPAAGAGDHCRVYAAAERSARMGQKMQITIDSPLPCMSKDANNRAIRVTVRTSSHEDITMASARKTEKVPDAA